MPENFDEMAKTWDGDPKRTDRAKTVAARIIEDTGGKTGLKAFEYGCGTGLLSFQLKDYFKVITLGDSSEGMLEVLNEKLADSGIGNMTPVRLDLEKDEPPAERFDVIYMLMTLHHVIDVDGVLVKFCRILNPSGFLCIADLDEEDGSFHGEGFEGHNGFNRQELATKLEKAGFSVVSDRIVYEVAKVRDGAEKKYPLFLMTAGKIGTL